MMLGKRKKKMVGREFSLLKTVLCFRQSTLKGLLSLKSMKLLSPSITTACALVAGAALMAAVSAIGQTSYYTTNGVEYPIAGSLPGDQMFPDAAVSPIGGFIVWQDNITDGSGWGISAERVSGDLSGSGDVFRVNVQGANDQENPRVALLKGGGAVFVWQGGAQGYQHIYARFMNSSNEFLTTADLMVNQTTNYFQANPAIATLNNSNVVVVWSSYDQAATNSYQDVYAKILSPTGATVQNDFLVNQFIPYNQRNPAVAALANGGFVISWVSEQETAYPTFVNGSLAVTNNSDLGVTGIQPSVDVYARLYLSNGAAAGNEIKVNSDLNPCADPAVAAAADGSFLISWAAYDMSSVTNQWDIYARSLNMGGTNGLNSSVVRLNSYLNSSQFRPKLSSIGNDYFAVWSSQGEDGSGLGVYGQFVHSDATLVGGEIRVNTTTVSQQMQPVVASDGSEQFLALWTSYTGTASSFDLFAQRYINVAAVLDPMPAPFVYAPFTLVSNVYQPQLVVTWAPLQGLNVSNYQVYVDGSSLPMGVVGTNQWTMTAANGLTASSTHSFQVSYSTAAGTAPKSPATSATTWGGANWYGIPFEWMQANFGTDISSWPSGLARIAPGGPSIYQAFLSGATADPSTWLEQTITQTPQGTFLDWHTVPGATYQVQVSTDTKSWSNLGVSRFASGYNDSIYVGGNGGSGFYRVVLLRQ